MKNQLVQIIDLGGPHSQLAAKAVREFGVYCEIRSKRITAEEIKAAAPVGIIVSGLGEPADFKVDDLGIPVLDGGKAFNPAVVMTDEEKEKLRGFLFDVCACTGDWSMEDYLEQEIERIKAQVGGGKVLLALSGGVDSSVCASLLTRAIGQNLTCIFVDHGLMRKNEATEIEAVFGNGNLNFIHVNAEARFLAKLAGVTDPERKRKIIGEEFIRVFEEEAKKIGSVDFLAQGTIYPDVTESGLDGNAVVKSHHNVGGLPDIVDFKELVEPLRPLYKEEVRALGRALGLPSNLTERQPFPGPGLGVRCIGELTKDRLDVLRDADYIFRDEIAKAGLSSEIQQYFAVLTNIQSTGVSSGSRTYDHTIALRAVNTTDFVHADWVRIPFDILESASKRITAEVTGVNRVVYDITSKPPATIEWE